jgi:hypothetical protein
MAGIPGGIGEIIMAGTRAASQAGAGIGVMTETIIEVVAIVMKVGTAMTVGTVADRWHKFAGNGSLQLAGFFFYGDCNKKGREIE